MLFELPSATLYYLGADKNIREWKITSDGIDLIISHGVLRGAMQERREAVPLGKGGRSQHQQLVSRINSRISKQKLKGYKETVEEAHKRRGTNALNLFKPMLAQPWQKVKDIDFDSALVQYKYDGNRCLITRHNGKLVAYSRNGKFITTIDHILQDIKLPDKLVLDGELYSHGFTLQQIVSWIKRKQSRSLKLRFHCYDVMVDAPYSERLKLLQSLELGPNAEVTPTWEFGQMASLEAGMQEAREKGYEGLILRLNTAKYEAGKRSKTLLKVKQFLDAEFIVTNIYESAKGMPMLTCQLNNGASFDTVVPGSMQEKAQILTARDQYIGRAVTVEYSVLTADGVPFHPIARRFRLDKE